MGGQVFLFLLRTHNSFICLWALPKLQKLSLAISESVPPLKDRSFDWSTYYFYCKSLRPHSSGVRFHYIINIVLPVGDVACGWVCIVLITIGVPLDGLEPELMITTSQRISMWPLKTFYWSEVVGGMKHNNTLRESQDKRATQWKSFSPLKWYILIHFFRRLKKSWPTTMSVDQHLYLCPAMQRLLSCPVLRHSELKRGLFCLPSQ